MCLFGAKDDYFYWKVWMFILFYFFNRSILFFIIFYLNFHRWFSFLKMNLNCENDGFIARIINKQLCWNDFLHIRLLEMRYETFQWIFDTISFIVLSVNWYKNNFIFLWKFWSNSKLTDISRWFKFWVKFRVDFNFEWHFE